jgi:hypothetical protein
VAPDLRLKWKPRLKVKYMKVHAREQNDFKAHLKTALGKFLLAFGEQ